MSFTYQCCRREPTSVNTFVQLAQRLSKLISAGLVVHPAAGHGDGTLLNALLHHCDGLAAIPRAGIVHRLDKDTTGLMVVAKTLVAQADLVAQLQARTVSRKYNAVVTGKLVAGGTVEAPIGRHPTLRTKMAVSRQGGKAAISHYRILNRFANFTHVEVSLETGRTHQIRVHMDYIHHPLVGDPVYGGRFRRPRGCSDTLAAKLSSFPRQALHANQLGLLHPLTGEACQWQVDLPGDMQSLLDTLADEDAA